MLEQRDTAAAGVLEGVTEGHQSAASIKFHAQALQVWSCAENARDLLVGACREGESLSVNHTDWNARSLAGWRGAGAAVRSCRLPTKAQFFFTNNLGALAG